jgi:hypothetical protein
LHEILSEEVLGFANIGLEAVSLSCRPEVAVSYAVLPSKDTSQCPPILVLDRDSLRS